MNQPVLKTHTTEIQPESGILKGEREEIAAILNRTLAHTYHLMFATQGIHWNVQGPLFYSTHKLTEEQYEELFSAIDVIAERVRALGGLAPYALDEVDVDTGFKRPDVSQDLETQIKRLAEGNEYIANSLRHAVTLAESSNDLQTADLLTSRIGVHEKNAWMLRAIIS